MNKPPYKIFAVILLMLVALISSQAFAQDNRQKQINQAQAVQKAQQKVKGQVLKVRQSKNNYQIKVLQKSGRVVTVNVDKKSGRITQTRE